MFMRGSFHFYSMVWRLLYTQLFKLAGPVQHTARAGGEKTATVDDPLLGQEGEEAQVVDVGGALGGEGFGAGGWRGR